MCVIVKRDIDCARIGNKMAAQSEKLESNNLNCALLQCLRVIESGHLWDHRHSLSRTNSFDGLYKSSRANFRQNGKS